MSNLKSTTQDILSSDVPRQLNGLISFRKLLSEGTEINFNDKDSQGVISSIISIMKKNQNPELVLETSQVLSELTSGYLDLTKKLDNAGILPLLIKMLDHSHHEIVRNSLKSIGIIVEEDIEMRNKAIKEGAIEKISSMLEIDPNEEIYHNGLFALSNLCRRKPYSEFSSLIPGMKVLSSAVQKEQQNEEYLLLSLTALVDLSDRSYTEIRQLIETGIVPSLVKLLDHKNHLIIIECLNIIGNIISVGTEEAKSLLAVQGFIQKVMSLGDNSDKDIRREAYWLISNLLSQFADVIEKFISSPENIKKLVDAAKDKDPEISKQACYALINATNHATINQIEKIVDAGIMSVISNVLENEELLMMGLEGLQNILEAGGLKTGSQTNSFLLQATNAGLEEKLENLAKHSNNEVSTEAIQIIHDHFKV